MMRLAVAYNGATLDTDDQTGAMFSDHDISNSGKRVSWIGVLCRWWLLQKAAAGSASALSVAAALTGAWLVVWGLIDWWQRQPDPVFSAAGIPLLGWYAIGVLFVAAVMWRRSRPNPPFGILVVLSLGLVPVPLLLMTIAAPLLGTVAFWCTAAACVVYSQFYLARGLKAVTGHPQRAAVALALASSLAFIGLCIVTNAIPDVWDPSDAATLSADDLADRETALFEQAERIDRQLDAVQRDPSPLPQAFFVGFAGVGDEKVFAQEIGLASRVIGERYASSTRQLLLINDERNLSDAPLASVTGLNYALEGIATRMRLDRDVLFLAISSHGSSDPTIAVANSNFPLVDLTPSDLAEALDEAGIKRRVILISACYAGGFIEPLRTPRTLLITAAAADRTSFGCASDSDLTYFGEAFYRDALPASISLRQAFDLASAAISAREQAEGETPSNPQAFFGSEIESILEQLPQGSLAGDAK